MTPTPRVALVYKNFAAWAGISHIGLGVSASKNKEYLGQNNIASEVVAARHNVDVVDYLKVRPDITHVVISAPWLSVRDVESMVVYFPNKKFVIVSHSNVGFLQADPGGVKLLRSYIELARELTNFSVGANCAKFQSWLSQAYDSEVTLLPNLYPTYGVEKRYRGTSPIKIGTFGAIRPQKNVMTAAAAALLIHKKLDVPVEFHLSTGREEGGGGLILSAIREMTGHLRGFELVERHWSTWQDFKRVVREMDLLIHVSYTESFNMVTADGIAEGVPSVVSTAIDWAPPNWMADSDNAEKIAETGLRLLSRDHRLDEGAVFLERHNQLGFQCWKQFLTV